LRLQVCPGGIARKIDYEVHIIGHPHILKGHFIGDEKSGRASSDEDEAAAEILSQRVRY
jgi:hypothetical protein